MKISFLYGITAGRWMRLLRENHFRVQPRYLHNAALISGLSLVNSILARGERRFDEEVRRTPLVAPPIFILGHWRGGTTHLQYLLHQDPQLGAPTTYQVSYPDTFLSAESWHAPRLEPFLPKKRPQDNMALSLSLPNEDELALSAQTGLSPYLAWAFPEREAHYLRYLTFREASREEIDRWQAAFRWYLQKLTVRHRRRLVLKSPPHTARIRVLRALYPDACFVHLYRDPYRVFQSSRHLYQTWMRHFAFLQRPDPSTIDARVMRLYELLYDAYFEEVGEIPAGRFHAMRYEDLERDPLGELRRMYDRFGMDGFDRAAPRFRRYLETLTRYEKNHYAPLEPALRETIAHRWARSFEAWGYAR